MNMKEKDDFKVGDKVRVTNFSKAGRGTIVAIEEGYITMGLNEPLPLKMVENSENLSIYFDRTFLRRIKARCAFFEKVEE